MACEQCDANKYKQFLDNISNVEVDKKEMATAISEVMELLKTKTCEYGTEVVSGYQAAGKASGSVGYTGAEVSAEFEAGQYAIGENTTSVGCDTIGVMAQKYAQTKKVMANVLSCNCQGLETNIANVNDLDLTIQSSSCGGLNIDQHILLKLHVVNEVTQQQENAMATLMDSMINTTVESIQNEIAGSNNPSSTNIQDVSTEINEDFRQNTITSNISNIKTELSNFNKGKITIKDSFFDKDCNINQSIVLDMLATNALANTLKTVMETKSMTEAIASLKTEKTETQKVFDGAGDSWNSGGGMGNGMEIGIYGLAALFIIGGMIMMRFKKYVFGFLTMLLGIGLAVLGIVLL